MKVAVLGPGGVGGFLAAMLARAGDDVLVIAREQTVSALEGDRLRLESGRFGDFDVTVRSAARLEEPVDAVLVTVKATQLDDAVGRVPARPQAPRSSFRFSTASSMSSGCGRSIRRKTWSRR
jgi:2-dehydropantoate 2-reductase